MPVLCRVCKTVNVYSSKIEYNTNTISFESYPIDNKAGGVCTVNPSNYVSKCTNCKDESFISKSDHLHIATAYLRGTD